jgi:hypothetical protein
MSTEEFIGMASISNPQKEAKLVERVFIKQLGARKSDKPVKYIAAPEDCTFKTDVLFEKKVVVYFQAGMKDDRPVATNVREATQAELDERAKQLAANQEARQAANAGPVEMEVTDAVKAEIVASVFDALEGTRNARSRVTLLSQNNDAVPDGMSTRQLVSICTADERIGLDKKPKKPVVLFIVGKGEIENIQKRAEANGAEGGDGEGKKRKRTRNKKAPREPLPVKDLTDADKAEIVTEALEKLADQENKSQAIIDLRKSMFETLKGVPTRDFVEILTVTGKVAVNKVENERAVISIV